MILTLFHFVMAMFVAGALSLGNSLIEGTYYTGYQTAVLFVLIAILFEAIAIRRSKGDGE